MTTDARTFSRSWPLLALLATSCSVRGPTDWGSYNVLTDTPPVAPRTVGGVTVSAEDYERIVRWGEGWFRGGVIETERATTDIAGMMMGTVQVPCAGSADPNCYTDEPVLRYYVQALDALDGVPGNLFTGNGGPDGSGFTNDLVLKFPPRTRLHGAIPVPEEVHTGLDVDAGAAWPIGLSGVPVTGDDAKLAYLPEPSKLGVGPAPEGKVRFRLSCALCHYSLDIDVDGKPDIHSTVIGQQTPGSPWKPEDGWGVGNQDLHIGWLLALSANPLLLSTVFSGPIGPDDPDNAPTTWMTWVREHYQAQPRDALREVAIGMILQPRGYADVAADGRYNTNQLPSLYTWHNWPSNSDGVFANAEDRNNIVWTSTLDFTGLIGTCKERGGAVELPWERPSIYRALPCDAFADMMVRNSPAAKDDPARIPGLVANVLGTSDGVPGVVRDDDVFVISGSPTMPKAVYEHPDNIAHHRQRTPADYGGDAQWRSGQLAVLGTRIRTPERVSQELGIDALIAKYPGLNKDEFVNNAVNAMLDWMRPPANATPLLAASRELVSEGQKVFEASGCGSCHRGPFGTDNQLHRISTDSRVEFGLPRAPSTAGWRVLNRGAGPAIGSEPQHAWDTRVLRRFTSPPFDPKTGQPYAQGGVLQGLMTVQPVGYKATLLLNLWASAPYLHDGGIGVAIAPGSAPAGTDLAALLARAGSADLLYGMGPILSQREQHPGTGPRPNAALSLQALLLSSERERVLAGNEQQVITVAPGSTYRPNGDAPPRKTVSMKELGAPGIGHEFWVDDVPGGKKITALVAYLLSLDDCPRALPGDPAEKACY
jgi:hypothetical protein